MQCLGRASIIVVEGSAVGQGHTHQQREGVVAALARVTAVRVPHQVCEGLPSRPRSAEGRRRQPGRLPCSATTGRQRRWHRGQRHQWLREAQGDLALDIRPGHPGDIAHAHELRGGASSPTKWMGQQLAEPWQSTHVIEFPDALEVAVVLAGAIDDGPRLPELCQDRCNGRLPERRWHSTWNDDVALPGEELQINLRQLCANGCRGSWGLPSSTRP
mmetsp:Transcript_92063/g.263792  ORF Transcript_92063/g.263792 Transcript_92063/m.263792 type:complete len:216 (+) Transcript_92063:577-1224(+)